MEGERLCMCPASELAGFRAKNVRDGGVDVHEAECDEEADPENTPPYLLEPPEDISVSEALEPEVLCIEVRQRHEAANPDERAEYPEQICLKFECTSPALLAPTVSEDTYYEGNSAEGYAE